MEMEREATKQTVEPTGCCPPFDPEPWHDKVVRWGDKTFITADIRTFFYVPFGIAKATTAAMEAIRTAGVEAPDAMILATAESPWHERLFFETKGPVPGYALEKIGGAFYAKVFDGPWKDAGNWHKEAAHDAGEKALDVERWFERWIYCPKCAKAYGHNYVVILGKIAEAVERAA